MKCQKVLKVGYDCVLMLCLCFSVFSSESFVQIPKGLWCRIICSATVTESDQVDHWSGTSDRQGVPILLVSLLSRTWFEAVVLVGILLQITGVLNNMKLFVLICEIDIINVISYIAGHSVCWWNLCLYTVGGIEKNNGLKFIEIEFEFWRF